MKTYNQTNIRKLKIMINKKSLQNNRNIFFKCRASIKVKGIKNLEWNFWAVVEIYYEDNEYCSKF